MSPEPVRRWKERTALLQSYLTRVSLAHAQARGGPLPPLLPSSAPICKCLSVVALAVLELTSARLAWDPHWTPSRHVPLCPACLPAFLPSLSSPSPAISPGRSLVGQTGLKTWVVENGFCLHSTGLMCVPHSWFLPCWCSGPPVSRQMPSPVPTEHSPLHYNCFLRELEFSALLHTQGPCECFFPSGQSPPHPLLKVTVQTLPSPDTSSR